MSFIGKLFGGGGGDEAAEASIRGSELEAEAQREALEYLKEREALPQQFREGALTQLAGIYGLPGGEGDQQGFIDRARQSPLYESIMGTQEAGEEAILRQGARFGGFRSGDTAANITDYASQLENQALLESYNQQIQGVSGLAGLPSMAPQIASGIAGIGRTLGQGQIAAAQSQQMGQQQGFGNLMGLGQLGLSAYEVFSDIRLKRDISYVGVSEQGHNIYKWNWNDLAAELELEGPGYGVLAHEIYETDPEAVGYEDGWITVDYSKLGVIH